MWSATQGQEPRKCARISCASVRMSMRFRIACIRPCSTISGWSKRCAPSAIVWPAAVTNEASLCLFRVAQEALNNAVRHGQPDAITVLLSAHDRGLRLAVSDNGSGFVADGMPRRASLGLASMRERVRLLHGQLDVESTPGRGTTVIAWVPA